VEWRWPRASTTFAALLLALALLALATGLADYLIAEKQLEAEQVAFDQIEGTFPDAHTARTVHAVMLIIGSGIVAAGIWLAAA
jgi:uncharacterized membrane protein YidH (DUF202 family)